MCTLYNNIKNAIYMFKKKNYTEIKIKIKNVCAKNILLLYIVYIF
jgi:hypothetical protein